MDFKESLRHFFSDKYNIAAVAVLLFAFAVRLYYFFLTKNQPVWWDEGDYLNIARDWAFGEPQWSLNPLRPLLFPSLIAIFLKLGASEQVIRLVPFFAALLSVFLIYKIGKELYNPNTGLFSAAMLGVFWSFLFYSFRILVDTLITMLFLLAVYLFWVGHEKENRQLLWLAGPALALAITTKFTSAILVFVIFGFLILSRKFEFFKNKNLWIFAGLGMVALLPFLLFDYFKFGNPFAFYLAAIPGRGGLQLTLWQNLSAYLNGIKLIEPVFLMLFFIGLLTLYKLVIGFDLLIKGEKTLRADLFLVLWLVIAFLAFGWIGINPDIGLEERYLFIVYPAIFIFAAKGLDRISNAVTKYNKYLALVIVSILLAFGGYQNLVHADQIIKDKLPSFLDVKQAGEWIQENSNDKDTIFSLHTQAEIQYSSDRQVTGFPGNIQNFTIAVESKKPKYVVVNPFFRLNNNQLEIVNYVFSHTTEFKPVAGFGPFIDQNNKIPQVTIFEVNYSAPFAYDENLTKTVP